MRWIWPLIIALLFLPIATIWNLMLRRWKAADWKELFFAFFVCLAICYLFFFFGQSRFLANLGVSIPLAAAVVSLVAVVLISQFRRRIDRRSEVKDE